MSRRKMKKTLKMDQEQKTLYNHAVIIGCYNVEVRTSTRRITNKL